MPPVHLIKIGASGHPKGKVMQRGVAIAPVFTHAVAEFSIPLLPKRRKISDLIRTITGIPWLCDELYLADDWILLNDVEEGRHAVDIMNSSRQDGCQIETEPVDVHFGDPIAQRIHHQLQNM